MASTASRLSGDRGVSPFYYLKITGIPYYFFATVDPTSSAHGAAAWTLPAGFSSKRAMDVPHAKLTQSIDLIGGIATPQRLKVEMVDFQASDASGQYNFFSRLFATGRSLSSSAVKKSFLSADLAASGAATFKSVGPDTFAASGDVYLGNETIGYSAVSRAADADGNMVNTFTISARNKYPCASTFPPNPYYRVRRDSAGKALGIGDVPVTSDLVTIVGRSCALYLGHVTQSSLPCTEAEAQLLFVGRVTAFDFVGGRYSIEADSIVADLANDATRVAPGLPIVEVKDQIVLTDPEWRTMSLGVYGSDSVGGVASREGMKEVTVTSGVYKLIGHLVEEVNRKIDASSLTKHGVRCELKTIGKEQRVTFSCVRPKDAAKNFTFTISGDKARAAGDVFVHGRSLLSALGWPPDANQTYTADDANTYELAGSYDKRAYIVAPRPPPSVFIPYDPVSTGQLFTVNGDDQPGSRFFTDQLDGSTQAWVRFGGQQVVQLVTADAANSQLRTSGPLESTVYGPGGIDSDAFIPTMVGYYYVPIGQTGTVEQVIVTPSIAAVPAPNGLIIAGSFMASSWGAGALHDLNFWPEGVGLGYQAIMDEPSFRVSTGYKFRRFVIVDRNTTLRELLEPVLKEHGLWLVWDPSVGKLTVRQQKLPSAATADSLSMDETNRSDDKEMTTAVWDRSFVRSGWEIHWGWQARGGKFIEGPMSFIDGYVMGFYGIANKVEEIDDKTLQRAKGFASPYAVLTELISRSVYTRHPWLRISRRLNKTWLLKVPGSTHKLVDKTIPNPFTGAMGIASADNIYCLLIEVGAVMGSLDVDVVALVQAVEPASLLRPWSPSARVDFTANSGGFTNGYDSVAKKLKFVKHYTNVTGAVFDGIDSVVGDKVLVTTRDNDGAPAYSYTAEVAAVAADGLTVTLVAALAGALDTAVESVMLLQKYTSNVAARQSGANAVAWMGDARDDLIQDTAQNSRWS